VSRQRTRSTNAQDFKEVQLSLFDPLPSQAEDELKVRHTRDAIATVLLSRIERAAEKNPRVSLDLTNEISQYATSWQALDLLLVERTVELELNPKRIAEGRQPIKLGYRLSESPSVDSTPGLVDLADLGLHHHLRGLTSVQKQLFERLINSRQPVQNAETNGNEESPEQGEVTLLPITCVESTLEAVEPIVNQIKERLEVLLHQGLPSLDSIYVRKIVTFVEESASNTCDHASQGLPAYEGFIAANRTKRRYRDKDRSQWVEVYTTYLACYDLGCGIYNSLISVPQYCSELAQIHIAELRSIEALRLATRPEVSSKPLEDGRGFGLSKMVEMIRSMADASDDYSHQYRAELNLESGGAALKFFTTTETASNDRLTPGTQVRLCFEAIRRTDY
jgi:hypothetical protein